MLPKLFFCEIMTVRSMKNLWFIQKCPQKLYL